LDALEALHSRNSSARLSGTVRQVALDHIIRAGLRAPDHGQLRPWRILVIEGEGRDRLGLLFAQAKLTSDPHQSTEQLAKLRGKPQRAPVILVVVARIVEHPKVPAVEQILSAGAVAQNMLVAAHALGLGAMWRTGEMTYNPMVQKGLGLDENEKIVGFIYLGEREGRQKSLPDVSIEDHVTRW
jgi:nitroreductase